MVKAKTSRGSGLTQMDGQCGKCKNKLKDEVDNLIQCDFCQFWFHYRCASLSKEEAELLSRLEPKGAKWACKVCSKGEVFVQSNPQLDNIEKSLDEIKSLVIGSLEPQVEAIKKTYAAAVQDIERNTKVLVSAAKQTLVKNENEQKEARDKNLILFGLQEFNTKQETVEEINKLFSECHLSKVIEKKNMYRLGGISEESDLKDKKPRPIKICTESREDKWEIVRRINSFKKGGIFAKLDMSKEEREEDFQLYQTLKKIRAENSTNRYKIIKKKIVKVDQ